MSTHHFRISLMAAASAVALVACSGETSSTTSAASSASSSSSSGASSSTSSSSSSGSSSGGEDQARLNRYRANLPKLATLKAPQPDPATQSSGGQPLVGDPAAYPEAARPAVFGVNGAVKSVIDILEGVTAQEPTAYNSETLEYVWGPHDNGDSDLVNDQWLVYARDHGSEGDFRYTWAILRGMGNDQATYEPIIWGGANPDADESNDDHGSGVILWDFEANEAFEDAHNSGHGVLDQGRFVTVYSRAPDAQDVTKINTFVVAAFRNFVPKDNPSAPAANFDYLYGHVNAPDFGVSFVNFDIVADIHPENPEGGPGSTADENLKLRLTFFDNGVGRGEARVTGGDIASEGYSSVDGVECWGDTVARDYYEVSIAGGTDGGPGQLVKEGELTDCHEVFQQSLAELNIPGLDDVPADMMAALEHAAQNGIPQE